MVLRCVQGERGSHRGWTGLRAAFCLVLAALAAVLSASPVLAARKPTPAPTPAQAPVPMRWVASWAASPEPARPPKVVIGAQTVRQIVRLSLGGVSLRLRLSNEFSDKPLVIAAAHVAVSANGPAIQPGTDRPVTFGGKPYITIPPGAKVVSDTVLLQTPPLANLAVSLYFPDGAVSGTEHYFAMQTAWLAPRDATAAPDFPRTSSITKRVVLSGVDVWAPAASKAVVVLGDQLTIGFGSTPDANRRWPDRLAERLVQRTPHPLAVVNAGIGGNRLLHDLLGPGALNRFDRDVLAQPNVGYLIVLIGINDLGFPGGRNLPQEDVSVDDMIAGYRQLSYRAHTEGIKVFIATIPPFGPVPERPGYYSDGAEAKRVAINAWIRKATEFDGVIDFESVVHDPATPNRLFPQFDMGDHLDLNDAGYHALGETVDIRLFD